MPRRGKRSPAPSAPEPWLVVQVKGVIRLGAPVFATAPAGSPRVVQPSRMIADDPPRARVCPRCGRAIGRVPRHFADRLLSLFVPVLRYRCEAPMYGWEGLVRRGRPGTVNHERGAQRLR